MAKHLRIRLDEWVAYDEKQNEELHDLLSCAIQEIMTQQETHLEMMAAAYLKYTSIDPARAVLIEQREGMSTIWYFAERQPDGTLHLPSDHIEMDNDHIFNGCPHCRTNLFYQLGDKWVIEIEGADRPYEIHFCPMCGMPLLDSQA